MEKAERAGRKLQRIWKRPGVSGRSAAEAGRAVCVHSPFPSWGRCVRKGL